MEKILNSEQYLVTDSYDRVEEKDVIPGVYTRITVEGHVSWIGPRNHFVNYVGVTHLESLLKESVRMRKI